MGFKFLSGGKTIDLSAASLKEHAPDLFNQIFEDGKSSAIESNTKSADDAKAEGITEGKKQARTEAKAIVALADEKSVGVAIQGFIEGKSESDITKQLLTTSQESLAKSEKANNFNAGAAKPAGEDDPQANAATEMQETIKSLWDDNEKIRKIFDDNKRNYLAACNEYSASEKIQEEFGGNLIGFLATKIAVDQKKATVHAG